jgi:flagellar hook assembly protein FlgD
VFNILGQEIATLHNAFVAAGSHTITWNGTDKTGRVVAAGLYLVRFTALTSSGAQQFSQIRKMMMVK